VVVAASAATTAVLREAVGGDPRVEFKDGGSVYGQRTPAAIAAVARTVNERAAGRNTRVRVIGEPDFGRTSRDWVEWQRYEAAINRSLAALPLWGLCLYDVQRLPDQVLESAYRTHPHLASPGARAANPRYADPADYLSTLEVPGEPLERTSPTFTAASVEHYTWVRHDLAEALGASAGSADVADDFLLAIDEVTTNATLHGRPPVCVTLWTSPAKLVCTVTDTGTGVADPFAGYTPPPGDDPTRGGIGLWLARRLCDHVDVWHDDRGTTVRLITRLPRADAGPSTPTLRGGPAEPEGGAAWT
jgi:anti-sigma regulatory factor (Ser/Thr protein kinase)